MAKFLAAGPPTDLKIMPHPQSHQSLAFHMEYKGKLLRCPERIRLPNRMELVKVPLTTLSNYAQPGGSVNQKFRGAGTASSCSAKRFYRCSVLFGLPGTNRPSPASALRRRRGVRARPPARVLARHFQLKKAQFNREPAMGGSNQFGIGIMNKIISSSLARTLAAVSAATLFSTGVCAQDLEKRVDALERKIDAVLELMQQQTNAKSASSAPSAVPAAKQATASNSTLERLRMEQLYLDVFTLPSTKKGEVPISVDEIAAGSEPVEAGSFKFGDFTKLDETRGLSSYEGGILQSWNGVLNIEKDGSHTFLLIGKKEQTKLALYNDCKTALFLNSEEITSISFNTDGFKEKKWTAQGKVPLQKGLYEFDFRLACRENNPATRDNVEIELRIASPDDRSAKPIPANLFGIKE